MQSTEAINEAAVSTDLSAVCLCHYDLPYFPQGRDGIPCHGPQVHLT